MQTSKKLLITLSAVFLASCAAPMERADWVLVGGSKADGNVTLGIDVPAKMGVTETPIEWDIGQANAEAQRRCKNWGFTGAEMYRDGQFPILKTCHAQGISPCWSKTYRAQYQCTNS